MTWLDFDWFSLWPWPCIFKVKYGICYISVKNGPIATKRKANIDRTLGLKCDHRVWPWPWPWPWIFKVQHGICYISAKNDPIATKRKANISIALVASKVTIGFDLGCGLDLEFSRKVKYGICLISQPKVVRRSGARIYQIVTGVTSDVGVPSTHLVFFRNVIVNCDVFHFSTFLYGIGRL